MGIVRTSREARARHTPGCIYEIIIRVDDFPVNTENRRRSRENTRPYVTKNGRTSAATMPQGQRTLVGEGASQSALPRRSPPVFFLR